MIRNSSVMLAFASKSHQTTLQNSGSMVFQPSLQQVSQVIPPSTTTAKTEIKVDIEPNLVNEDEVIGLEQVWDQMTQKNANSLAEMLNVHDELDYTGFRRPQICGHRGALYEEPENTLQGFRAASDMGCDAVELDVFLLKDNKLVVFHGDGNDKTPGSIYSYCGFEGRIEDFTSQEARKLKLNAECLDESSPFYCPQEKLDTAYIPELEEVLKDAKKSGLYVKIELKGKGTEIPALELVEKLGMENQCSFASFYHDRVARIRELRPELKPDGSHRIITGCLFNGNVPHDFVEISKTYGASEIHLRYDTCSKDRVENIHREGLRSMAWFRGPASMQEESSRFHDVGDEDEKMYLTLLKTGVMSLCMNRPQNLVNLLQNKHATPPHEALAQ